MLDTLNGKRYSVGQVARIVGVHDATVWRWAIHGVKGRRLRTIFIGGRRFVPRDALEEFLSGDDSEKQTIDTSSQKASNAAAKEVAPI